MTSFAPVPSTNLVIDSDGRVYGPRGERTVTYDKARRYSHGYVTANVGGVHRKIRVHSAVAHAFLRPRPDGYHVCHWDGDVHNNRACNLYYGTAVENAADRKRHGNYPPGNFTSPLTLDVVRSIREAPYQPGLCRELARSYGVQPPAIWKIRNGYTWRGAR